MALRIIIGDDDPLIREALEVIFRRDPDFQLVSVSRDGKEALEACRALRVDVALLDIRMPIMDGIAAAAAIRKVTSTKVLLLSTFKDEELVRGALASGASGYILKGAGAQEIKDAVRLAAAGHRVFSDDVFSAMSQGAAQAHGDVSFLSEREQDIVKLVSEGYSNKEAAQALGLSEGTVKNYISAILDKLGLRQRTQIALYYLSGRKDFS